MPKFINSVSWRRLLLKRNTHSDSSQEPLRHISDNDTDKEDNSLNRFVSQDESEDEEGNSEEYSYSRHDVDEMFDLNSNRGF